MNDRLVLTRTSGQFQNTRQPMSTITNHWIIFGSENDSSNSIPPMNSSNISQPFQPIWVSLSLISIIIFTVGGNSLVCIAVIRERHLQNTTNYFLTSLAFTDCLVACLVMPLAVTVELIGHFPFDALACNVWLTFDVCCSTSSIWHMSVMSLDRYLTLRYPLKYGRHKRRSLMAYKIITIWLISFAICLPLFILGLVDTSNVYNEQTHGCFPAHRTFKIYGSFVAFFIPLIIMIVTYALTMSALQQAHTTKKARKERQARIRAVVNLATIAVRWKRAVNTVEIPDKKKSNVTVQLAAQSVEAKAIEKGSPRKRASSLLTDSHPRKSRFTSSQRLSESPRPFSVNQWRKTREKILKPLPERSTEHSSTHHLEPSPSNSSQLQAKRSHSCTPLLDVEVHRKDQRRSSSVHTLLQIRRDSAKISEELAKLSAQLSASMSNEGSMSKRPSLSVPSENGTPTIDQLLAEISVSQPIVIPSSLLSLNPKKRGRSHSADIRLPTSVTNNEKTSTTNQPIPNLLVTHDSIQHLPTTSLEVLRHHLTFDNTCQRIKDWITVSTSSNTLHIQSEPKIISTRCVSAIHVTEKTPMLSASQQCFPPLTNVKRYFPRIEQLYGKTSASSSISRHQQEAVLDDHIASVQTSTVHQRASVCSIASSMLTTRSRQNRPSTCSSIGSSSRKGTIRQRPPRLNDGMSQNSFQMVSLDTDDSSSGTSSLTQHSVNVQCALAGTNTPKDRSTRRKKQKFKYLAKSSANNERKAMRVLLIIFSIFVLLWTPFFTINLLSCFTTNIHPVLVSVATWLGYCSSGANPIIYTIFSRAFRRAFLDILACRKSIHTHRPSQMFRSSRNSMTLPVGRKLSALSKGPN